MGLRLRHLMLEALGLGNAPQAFKPATKKRTKPDQSKKRGAVRHESVTESEDETDGRPQKLSKVEDGDGNVSPVRRSSRNKGKSLNYKDDGDNTALAARKLPRVVTDRARAGMEKAPRDINIRKYDP